MEKEDIENKLCSKLWKISQKGRLRKAVEFCSPSHIITKSLLVWPDLGVEDEPGDGVQELLLYAGDPEGVQPALLDPLHAVQHEEDVGGVGGVDIEVPRPSHLPPPLHLQQLQLRGQKGRPHDLPSCLQMIQ